MDYVRGRAEVAALMEGADYIDSRSIASGKSLRAFVASCLSYMPGWLRFLFLIRAGFVRLLGMRQEDISHDTTVREEEVSLTPGDKVSFLTVTAARDKEYWIAEATDKHLSASLGFVVEPLGDGRKLFHSFTVVTFRHWTGPVYFNVIRPFHHLVVRAMLNHAAKDA